MVPTETHGGDRRATIVEVVFSAQGNGSFGQRVVGEEMRREEMQSIGPRPDTKKRSSIIARPFCGYLAIFKSRLLVRNGCPKASGIDSCDDRCCVEAFAGAS